MLRLKTRYVNWHTKGVPVRKAEAPRRCAGWSLADSLRLLEQHYAIDRDDQVIDLTLLDPLVGIAGVGPSSARALVEHGFTEVRSIAAAGVDDLARVPGFGAARAAAVKASAEGLAHQ